MRPNIWRARDLPSELQGIMPVFQPLEHILDEPDILTPPRSPLMRTLNNSAVPLPTPTPEEILIQSAQISDPLMEVLDDTNKCPSEELFNNETSYNFFSTDSFEAPTTSANSLGSIPQCNSTPPRDEDEEDLKLDFIKFHPSFEEELEKSLSLDQLFDPNGEFSYISCTPSSRKCKKCLDNAGFATGVVYCKTCGAHDEEHPPDYVNDQLFGLPSKQEPKKATGKTESKELIKSSSKALHQTKPTAVFKSKYQLKSDPFLPFMSLPLSELSSCAEYTSKPASLSLVTPDSSDTDTDCEGPTLEERRDHVHNDHNYCFGPGQHSRGPSFNKSVGRSTDACLVDSDDEIDVESTSDLKLSAFAADFYSSSIIFKKTLPRRGRPQPVASTSAAAVASTSTASGPAKRGRKPGQKGTRKVGRPPKYPREEARPAPYQRRAPGRRPGQTRADTMDPERRNLHNTMERARRVELKNRYDILRDLLPDVRDRARAPKVEILRSAASQSTFLAREDCTLSNQKEMLERYAQALREKADRLGIPVPIACS